MIGIEYYKFSVILDDVILRLARKLIFSLKFKKVFELV